MPTYTYICPDCGPFIVTTSVPKYKAVLLCPACKGSCTRDFLGDVASLQKPFDSTPKTVGSLADRNASKLSNDEKRELKKKLLINSEKEQSRELPAGMSRITREDRERERDE